MTLPTIVKDVDFAAIKMAADIARNAHRTLGMKAGDGPKARPTLAQINSTLDRLTSIANILDTTLAALTVLPAIPHASDVEKQIVGKLVTDLLAAGFNISIDDGGGLDESPLAHSTDAAAIFAALSSTDTDRIYVYQGQGKSCFGWVYLVWGNDVDVISDYTTNLEPHLAGANQLAEELEA